jgi:amino acid transporter, AAT family
MTAFKNNYLHGLIAFVVMVAINFALWRLFFAPSNGVFKLFTPFYGLSLVALFLYAIILFADIFGYRNEAGSIGKGILLLAGTTVFFGVVYYGFFWNLLGKFGITYFSPQALIDTGGTGLEMWNARENSSLAILYLSTALIWVSYIWNAGMGDSPWDNGGLKRSIIGSSKFFASAFIAIIVYAIFYHPNVTALFVPRQIFAGVMPWWEEIAMTSSSFYHLGWMFSGLFLIMLLVDCADGFPFNLMRGERSGSLMGLLTALLISVVGGFIFMYIAQAVMTYFWFEPFTGGNYTDDPRFRYLHTAEVAAFLMLGLVIVKVFFNNVVQTSSRWLNFISRIFVIAIAGGALYLFYYSETLGPKFVDRVPGIGNMDETSLAWTLMSLALIFVYDKYFNAILIRKKI